MNNAVYHGGSFSIGRNYSGGSVSSVYSSQEANTGYSISGLTTGAGGSFEGAPGVWQVYVSEGITSNALGRFTIVTPGYYRIHAGGTFRPNTSNWIIRVGFRVNLSTIHATKVSGNVASNYHFTSEDIILPLVANDYIRCAYGIDFVGSSTTVDFEEMFLTIVKVD